VDYQAQLLQAIEKRTFFEGRTSVQGPEYHVGYGIDDNYARCLGASIASICLNNPGLPLVFHILASRLGAENTQRIKQLASQFKINLYLYIINEAVFRVLPTEEHLPVSTYYRFIFPLILKSERVLYIDADIICLGEIKPLFTLDLEEKIIAAVPDNAVIARKRNAALQLHQHIYFNAGVLLIDSEKWNAAQVGNKVIHVLGAEPQKFRYLDQDALNLILTGQILYLDKAWNRINTPGMSPKETINLLHFAAHPKPWSIAWPISNLCNDFTQDIYARYEAMTPWQECLPLMPRNYKEMKFYAKCLLAQGQYREGLSWYARYIKTKLAK
jgi:lipopolysaccharide biosynthesis glycosyltransferase